MAGPKVGAFLQIERHLTRWFAQQFGFPETGGGLFLSGGAMANLVGLKLARDFWGAPTLTTAGVAALNTFAHDAIADSAADWQRASRQNALRQLIAGSPDYQTA